MSRKKNTFGKIFLSLFGFVAIAFGVCFGILYFTKTGPFKIPGVVYYDDSLTAEEKSLFEGIFTDEVVLDKDVYISANDSYNRPEPQDGVFLSQIFVPVADFYDTRSDTSEYADGEFSYIDIAQLDYTRKLLSIEGEYFLDSFNTGAKFRAITFESDKFNEEIMPLIENAMNREFPNKENTLTFAQTGVTALSRGMNAKLNSVGNATYFAEKIGDFLSNFDLTHTSNESSFSKYAYSRNICSDHRFIDTLLAIGLDIVELTGNHNQDCGDEAALQTINTYREKGIKIVGGGETADQAAVPLLINQKDNNITFLAYNLSTGGATYDNTPGANQYYENKAAQSIAEAKARGDYVIVDVQYYECSSYDYTYENRICDYADSAAGDQIGFFRHLIDLGADLVVGTSAHQPQTFELYGSGVIYYGLGNLFFDQIWWPGTTRSLVLGHYFYNNKLLQTKISPTVYDAAMQTTLMDQASAANFIKRLIEAKP